jgi:SHS2 domain-containing protein
MGRAEVFEHTADLGLRIAATDLRDLFVTAAIALCDLIVVNRADVRLLSTEAVTLQADSPAELLIAWLNELIFRCETEHRLYSRFEVTLDDGGQRLEATIGGEPIDPARHILDHEVKAATHHGLTVTHENGQWLAEVILDI